MKQSMFALAAGVLLLAACGDDDDDDEIATLVDAGTETTNDPVTSPGYGDGDGDSDGDGDDGDSSARVVERRDIVANTPGAEQTDPQLLNAWGLAFNPEGVAWVSAAGSGVSEVYDAAGQHVIDPVVIPGPAGSSEASEPTGQVWNGEAGEFNGDRFIFATEDGVISGWQPDFGLQAMVRVDNSENEANYKGVTIVRDAGGTARLIAADFHNGRIDVYDTSYAPIATDGGFEDPQIPDGFAPFNVQEVAGALIVTYALQDEEAEDDVAGIGNGYVNVFSADGALISRLIAQERLNSPWGVALAPAEFAAAPDKLLIGNFGDGLILVYSVSQGDSGELTAEFDGALRDTSGDDLAIEGLWALRFGPGAGGFESNQLYFTAGPNDEEDGVFGVLSSASRD